VNRAFGIVCCRRRPVFATTSLFVFLAIERPGRMAPRRRRALCLLLVPAASFPLGAKRAWDKGDAQYDVRFPFLHPSSHTKKKTPIRS